MNKKNLIKGTLVYSVSNIITKIGSIIFLPIVANILTEEEYGIIGILSPITICVTIILGFGIYNAQMKKYVEVKDNKKELGTYIFSINLFLFLFSGLFILVLILPSSKGYAEYFLKILNLEKVSYNPLILMAVLIGVINIFNTLSSTFYRMGKKYLVVSIGSIISFFLNYILIIYFVKNKGLGVEGYILANLIAVSILFFFYAKGYFTKMSLSLKGTYIKYSLINGVPLVFIELTDQLVNFADRFVLAKYVDLKVVGYYTLAYTCGRVLSVVTASFINSWTPEFYEEMNKDSTNTIKITRVLEQFIAILVIICVLGQLFSPELIKLFFPAKFYGAIPFIPVILPAIVIQAFYCLDYFLHFNEKSWLIIFLAVFCFVFNIVTNILFIPTFGPIIAAWTTLLAFLFRTMIEMFILKKKFNVVFNYKKLFIYLALIVNPVVIYLGSLSTFNIYLSVLKFVYIFIMFKIIVNKEISMKIKSIVLKLTNKISKNKL